ILTAANLGVVSAGTVGLNVASNHVTGVFAANNLLAASAVRFVDATAFTVGTIPASPPFLTVIGVTTLNGPFTAAAAGALSVVNGITLGTGALSLTASGPATFTNSALQAGTGTVSGSMSNAVVMNYSVNTTFTVNSPNTGSITNSSIAISSGLIFN